jgi:hypothetical protein
MAMNSARVLGLCLFLTFTTGILSMMCVNLFGSWTLVVFVPLWSLLCAYAGYAYARLTE